MPEDYHKGALLFLIDCGAVDNFMYFVIFEPSFCINVTMSNVFENFHEIGCTCDVSQAICINMDAFGYKRVD